MRDKIKNALAACVVVATLAAIVALFGPVAYLAAVSVLLVAGWLYGIGDAA